MHFIVLNPPGKPVKVGLSNALFNSTFIYHYSDPLYRVLKLTLKLETRVVETRSEKFFTDFKSICKFKLQVKREFYSVPCTKNSIFFFIQLAG